MSFMPSFADQQALAEHQLRGLRWTVDHAFHGSPFYKERLAAAGVEPGGIGSLDDLAKLPFTTADDLKEGYPLPLLSVPVEEVVRVHASSGTTGKRKVLAYTNADIDDWSFMFARCYEMAELSAADRVQIMVGYGIWTAGVGFQAGCERFGALALPMGPGNLEMQCQFLVDFETTVLCCTSSMALLIAEEVKRRGIQDQVEVEKVIYGSERTSQAMRERIGQALGAELFDIPGLTELYGPGTGIECAAHQGIHYWADYYILEIIDPLTMEPVAPGEVGEMVVTTLCKQAAPLIRYRTRDLCRLLPEPCACGNPLPRHDRILGRSDDMIIFRAVNIYPGQIDHVLSGVEGLGSEYQVILERGDDGRDYMTIKVERAPEGGAGDDQALAQAVSRRVKQQIMVSTAVRIVDYASLPRSERKSRRIFDRREEE
ncbi:MAG: phenylacetate--CoA ligase [Desulfarculaceae bacterium]|nr:phenylacetate--CoA ligase [Desulfarculaceae bacterium]MCF8071298.1 phenylacetate--CoA ligase [Desulfarculaceae bacterium]MCF8101623.1 phenylacetate--CoA ligase [Desulfarculaceae bacterium]MCF8117437.1 phenylacetate--CoA ligase [Desulfarculaceae bacterium]